MARLNRRLLDARSCVVIAAREGSLPRSGVLLNDDFSPEDPRGPSCSAMPGCWTARRPCRTSRAQKGDRQSASACAFCTDRWPDVKQKAFLPHVSHLCGRSPECVGMCATRSPHCEKASPHVLHSHWRSPECVRRSLTPRAASGCWTRRQCRQVAGRQEEILLAARRALVRAVAGVRPHALSGC